MNLLFELSHDAVVRSIYAHTLTMPELDARFSTKLSRRLDLENAGNCPGKRDGDFAALLLGKSELPCSDWGMTGADLVASAVKMGRIWAQ